MHRLIAAAAVVLGLAAAPDALAAPPTLDWAPCDGLECATAKVPLDHDEPAGEQISLALVRRPAGDPSRRIGSLFVNNGGPGNSAVDFVRRDAESVYSPEVLERFDVIGMDPRGVGGSTPVRCFADVEEQGGFLGALPAFPVGRDEERAFAAAQAELGRRCLARNGDLLSHLSTANVARDLDLLRRAVGDSKLTYVGHSYGSMLGATYANLFPGRVRAVVMDSVLDPVGYTTGVLPMSLRVDSQRSTSRTLRFFLESCDAAGERCAFSAGDPVKEFDRLMERLRKAPVLGFTYAQAVENVRGALSFPPVWPELAQGLAAVRDGGGAARLAAIEDEYDNGQEALTAIICSETDNPRDPRVWPLAARLADLATPYFGAPWAYISQACATWPAFDHDRYAGPFDRKAAAPPLLVNARYDAFSSLTRARAVAERMPGARLLTVDGPGHTLEGTDSACADAAVERYLIAGKLPAKGAVCEQDSVPFG
jgi:pimeloyl-ACP methyl ester carboxylesterase